MKLGEIEWNENQLREVIDFIYDTAVEHGKCPVRVEIHSVESGRSISKEIVKRLKDGIVEQSELAPSESDPWSTERPEGWGVGWGCKSDDSDTLGESVLCVDDQDVDIFYPFLSVWVPSIDKSVTIRTDSITHYGPRVKVPGC